jgi:DNA repair exonuclease SbcCD ATPase subunit
VKIVKLSAENIKRLRAVEITPDGNTVVIAGRNGQGKTSVLDAIWFALGGGPATKGTSKPIRDGEDSAQVTLDLGELLVTRTWKGDKTVLKVESADGAVYKSPQSMLDSLVGRLSFDPLAFAQQDERTQLKSLLELVELPFDPDDLARRREGLYEQRTDVGRTGKQLDGQFAGIAAPDPDLPSDEINVAKVLAEHRAAREAITIYDAAVREVEGIVASVGRYTERVSQLENQLDDARNTLAEHEKDLETGQRHADELLAGLPDVAAIEKQLATAEDTNTAIRRGKQRAELGERVATARAEYQELSEKITALDAEKSAAIAAATMPIDGLAFDEQGVTYRSVPFKQCSAAEQLRVSLAMAMAMNPSIRVIRITDGSLLDSQNMALIEEMAVEQDYQVWIERVDETGKVGVVIEDGLVAS